MASENFERGLALRKKVLGEAHVDRAFAAADDFSRPLQEIVTEFAWGTIWTREGLEPRIRSFLNLGVLMTLSMPTELKSHIRGALNNGISREEIREAFLHTAVYCGMPKCLEAFRLAQEVFAEIDGAGEAGST